MTNVSLLAAPYLLGVVCCYNIVFILFCLVSRGIVRYIQFVIGL